MIPLVFSDKRTRNSEKARDAERAIFNLLERINDNKGSITHYLRKSTAMFGFVFHDQTFDQEEIDFVYVTIYGLMVVECKGTTTKRRAQNDFEYACGQLRRKVEKLVSSLDLPDDIPIFKVVSLPLLSRCDIETVDRISVLFKEDLSNFESWLRRKGFLVQGNAISFDYYVRIATGFLTKYHTNGTKKINNCRQFKTQGISDCNDNLERSSCKFYTREQAKLLKVTYFNDWWITGAAGTGKTFVLKHRVKNLTETYADNEQNIIQNIILVITYNVAINEDIE